MRSIAVVAWHEFVEGVWSWGFALLVFGLPLLWTVFGGISGAAVAMSAMRPVDVVVVDATGTLGDEVAATLTTPVHVVDDPTGGDPEALDALVRSREIDGWVHLDATTLETGAFTWRGLARPSEGSERVLEGAIWQVSLERALGDDVAVYDRFRGSDGMAAIDLDERDDTARAAAGADTLVLYLGLGIVGLPILMYAGRIAESVAKEKEQGIAEVMTCAVRPDHLLAGKIVGVGGMATLHATVWASPFVVLAWGAGLEGLGPEAAAQTQAIVAALGGPVGVAVLCALGAGGYLAIATMLATVGAIFPGKSVHSWMTMGLFLAFMVAMPLLPASLDDPHRLDVVIASFVPPLTPFLMWPRYLGGAPAWQVGLGVVEMFLLAALGTWVAGRLYRMEMQWSGHRPSLVQIAGALRTR